MNSRIIQLVSAVVCVIAVALSGRMLPALLRSSEEHGLRYTDIAVEGAPPWVALGTVIGSLRGIIVDVLWIKVDMMKSKGLFYEVMADADLITKLQPRFAQVWAFQGHNMAYNISVATHTQEERWEWVNAGIRLVRNEGLRHNPNDLVLHKELAFWHAHKIEGYSDDAHLFYKRMFTREWHFLLGEPPVEYEDRVAWIKRIADAPSTLDEAERRTPGVKALIARIDATLAPFGENIRFRVSREFLMNHGVWEAVTTQSAAAQILGYEKQYRAESKFFNAFDEIATDPAAQAAWETLLLHVRKRVLIDEYNMDPRLMYEYTRDLGPIDWRHGQSHALYWSRRGAQFGEMRVSEDDDIYKILNNDRLQLQAMQDLARYGRITFDPFSTELPSRFPDPRWIDTIESMFETFYAKHYGTRGAGGESFIAFLKNFMSSAIREAYRAGEVERAEGLLATLDERFGSGASPPNNLYKVPLDVFVQREIAGEYWFQPHLAPSEAVAALRNGFRRGIGQDQPELWRQAQGFVEGVIRIFRENEYYDFTNKFGEGRMKDLLANLGRTTESAFLQLMTDPLVPMQEKATIWSKVDKFEPSLRLKVYDRMAAPLGQQLARHELSARFGLNDLFPPPPGLEAYRAQLAAERIRAEQEAEAARERDEIGRK